MLVKIKGDFIKVSQLLKKMKIVDSGGQTKEFLATNQVIINDKKCESRGTKVFINDVVWINDELYKIVSEDTGEEK
ncbi:RNA-binding S4 domain-containing protein [Mesomycoplasma molare]|uniref:RNA-binding S4 domain-containing protein n=1 Tax=Mesomycoplasma molare TaxID=171288 RepID=A0ABY5TXA2_9BACT|nr:RNA-binding S4 domain-containing protein [Mesomycoplasma molare]UWD34211.1 RNA-binding S4 domain-containing protein [Mesomycoplasma molare]